MELSRGIAAELIRLAQVREQGGFLDDAAKGYDAAALIAERQGDHAALAAALRHRAVLHHHASESPQATRLCRRSYELAQELGHEGLAAEALNTLGGVELETGELELARHSLERALVFAGRWAHLLARVEQNLGIVANVRGDLSIAADHYGRSLRAFRRARDRKGCAIAYHNLGMVSGDQHLWDEADRYFLLAYRLGRRLGDIRLQGLSLMNHTEVHLALRRYGAARRSAESALRLFEEVGTRMDLADGFKMLGLVFPHLGRPAQAEPWLRSAVELAASTGSALCEAEASRDLARLYLQLGRQGEALPLLRSAHRLFLRLGAHADASATAAMLEEFRAAG